MQLHSRCNLNGLCTDDFLNTPSERSNKVILSFFNFFFFNLNSFRVLGPCPFSSVDAKWAKRPVTATREEHSRHLPSQKVLVIQQFGMLTRLPQAVEAEVEVHLDHLFAFTSEKSCWIHSYLIFYFAFVPLSWIKMNWKCHLSVLEFPKHKKHLIKRKIAFYNVVLYTWQCQKCVKMSCFGRSGLFLQCLWVMCCPLLDRVVIHFCVYVTV